MKKMGSKAEPAKRSVSVYIDKEILEVIKEEAEKEFPDKELELQYGGQPIYYYMISAE